MAKRRGRGAGGGMPGGMGGMMGKFQKMQEDMEKAREELETATVEVSVGGGAITVVITGHQRIQSVSINPEMIDTSEEDWLTDLEDLLVLATNQAVEESQTMAAERMEEITGGLGNIPGLGGLLGQ
ncbi:MAG: YbaB/EbfC family nucleoid-associated protein [Chloroflexota bacterium]